MGLENLCIFYGFRIDVVVGEGVLGFVFGSGVFLLGMVGLVFLGFLVEYVRC